MTEHEYGPVGEWFPTTSDGWAAYIPCSRCHHSFPVQLFAGAAIDPESRRRAVEHLKLIYNESHPCDEARAKAAELYWNRLFKEGP